MIVGARLRAHEDAIAKTAWHVAAFSRIEKLKPLKHYLDAAEREANPERGAQDLREMIGRMAERQTNSKNQGS